MIKHLATYLGFSMTLLSLDVSAGSVALPGLNRAITMPVVSYKEARFKGIIKQQYDFSCGSAALASLLSYHYHDPVSEQEVFDTMYKNGDKDKIAKEGFSLLDMKKYLENRGYPADGYIAGLDKLATLTKVPVITLINTKGYNHFVVIKGISAQEVMIGDPAQGIKVMTRKAFEEAWYNKIAFVIKSKIESGRETFNQQADWNIRGKAPFGTVLSREGLASFTLSLPHPMEF